MARALVVMLLLHGGIKTLGVRVRHQNQSALQIARLNDHLAVTRVNYPGLESHPQHARSRNEPDSAATTHERVSDEKDGA